MLKHYTLNNVYTVTAGKYHEAAYALGGRARISRLTGYNQVSVDIWVEERNWRELLNYVRNAR